MDAHDKLFYRLNDPDPHTQAVAELDMLDEIFGGNFVEVGSAARLKPSHAPGRWRGRARSHRVRPPARMRRRTGTYTNASNRRIRSGGWPSA